MAKKRKVVIGMLGVMLDAGGGAGRWERWRPTVSLCQHDDLVIDRLELLHQKRYAEQARTVIRDIASVSPETKVVAQNIEFDDPWDLEEVYAALYEFARGYKFDTEREEYFIHLTTGTHIAQICLFLLTESHRFPARLIQTSPPPNRAKKTSPGEFSIVDLDLSKYDKLAARFRTEQTEAVSFLKSGIPTRNAKFNRLIERIEQVALVARDPVLLIGATGAGKSQLARRIYELKKTRHKLAGAFIEINCATLRGDSAMSTLFGHVKGAFTGALEKREGLLKAADGGVLFLDEIGELGADEQAMLLNALEEKAFRPFGSDRDARSDFQLIAGTNRDLAADVASGKFREDLLARINLWTFQLPSLAERREDIEPNLDYELEKFAARAGDAIIFTRDARERFLKFATSNEAAWRGNFRDLNGAVTRMATLSTGGRIGAEQVKEEIERLRAAWQAGDGNSAARGARAGAATRWNNGASESGNAADEFLSRWLSAEELAEIDLFDRLQLVNVIEVCRVSTSLSAAGRKLFHASRARLSAKNDADRLRKYLARFGLDWQTMKV